MPAGRNTAYNPECLERVAALGAGGATDDEIAKALKIHRATFYRWQAQHPEFRDALKAGKQVADDRVVRSLYSRAVGYNFRATKIMQFQGREVIVPYDEHVAPDVTACIFWLKNRQRDEWRDRQDHEHSGPNGGLIAIAAIVTDDPAAAAKQYMDMIKG